MDVDPKELPDRIAWLVRNLPDRIDDSERYRLREEIQEIVRLAHRVCAGLVLEATAAGISAEETAEILCDCDEIYKDR